MSNKIGEDWNSYFEDVIPPTAGRTQVTETRRAFYAGAMALLTRIKAIDVDDEDEGARQLQTLEDEILAFYAEVKAGRK